MTWQKKSVMDCRNDLISDYLKGIFPVSELARRHSISRKTAHKWIKRFNEKGYAGLVDLSRAPRRTPHSTNTKTVKQIIGVKHKHPFWGPKKVVDYLKRLYPEKRWPADSTVGDILKRNGLVKPRRVKHRAPIDLQRRGFATAYSSDECWSADYKGDFLLGNKQRCYPLTITDNYSRFILDCRAVSGTGQDEARYWFEKVFKKYGLPKRLLTDNGTPFVSSGITGLTRLSKWWIDLGIIHERIDPGKPTQNSRHERMHKTLKAETCIKSSHNMIDQQCQFDDFIHEYNVERSHEGLDRETPEMYFEGSERRLPKISKSPKYSEEFIVRKVRHNGEIKWDGKRIYLGEVLRKEAVGLRSISDKLWEIKYRHHTVGILNENKQAIERVAKKHRKYLEDASLDIQAAPLRSTA